MTGIPDVLVVGAGLAGLAAARNLARAGHTVHILEKSRGVAGRAATRRLELDGRVVPVDHGAQYFTAKNQRLSALLPKLIQQGLVREWARSFPALKPGGIVAQPPRHPRYACPDGMSTLGKAFWQGWEAYDQPLPLEIEALVTGVQKATDGWTVTLEDG
jgi:predicted NAD/FAD-dependent oxidoreductase